MQNENEYTGLTHESYVWWMSRILAILSLPIAAVTAYAAATTTNKSAAPALLVFALVMVGGFIYSLYAIEPRIDLMPAFRYFEQNWKLTASGIVLGLMLIIHGCYTLLFYASNYRLGSWSFVQITMGLFFFGASCTILVYSDSDQ